MNRCQLGLAALAVGAMASGVASSAVLPRTTIVDYTITASDFIYAGGPTGGSAPYDPATFVFSVTLDPFTKTVDSTSAIDVTSFSAPYTAKVSYHPNHFQGIVVASDPISNTYGNLPNTFGIIILNAFGNTPVGTFSETSAGGTVFHARTNIITDTVVQTAVPEPAVWAMMLVGIAGLGGVCRLRRPRPTISVSLTA